MGVSSLVYISMFALKGIKDSGGPRIAQSWRSFEDRIQEEGKDLERANS